MNFFLAFFLMIVSPYKFSEFKADNKEYFDLSFLIKTWKIEKIEIFEEKTIIHTNDEILQIKSDSSFIIFFDGKVTNKGQWSFNDSYLTFTTTENSFKQKFKLINLSQNQLIIDYIGPENGNVIRKYFTQFK